MKGNFLSPNYLKCRRLSSGALVKAPPWPRGSMFSATWTWKGPPLQSFPFLPDLLQNCDAPADNAGASVRRESGARWVPTGGTGRLLSWKSGWLRRVGVGRPAGLQAGLPRSTASSRLKAPPPLRLQPTALLPPALHLPRRRPAPAGGSAPGVGRGGAAPGPGGGKAETAGPRRRPPVEAARGRASRQLRALQLPESESFGSACKTCTLLLPPPRPSGACALRLSCLALRAHALLLPVGNFTLLLAPFCSQGTEHPGAPATSVEVCCFCFSLAASRLVHLRSLTFCQRGREINRGCCPARLRRREGQPELGGARGTPLGEFDPRKP